MLVIVVENAPPKLRGYLSFLSLQVATGVYVANLPASHRELIWAQLVDWARADTHAVMVWGASAANEQGLACRVHGQPRRRVTEIEGLLISTWVQEQAETQDRFRSRGLGTPSET